MKYSKQPVLYRETTGEAAGFLFVYSAFGCFCTVGGDAGGSVGVLKGGVWNMQLLRFLNSGPGSDLRFKTSVQKQPSSRNTTNPMKGLSKKKGFKRCPTPLTSENTCITSWSWCSIWFLSLCLPASPLLSPLQDFASAHRDTLNPTTRHTCNPFLSITQKKTPGASFRFLSRLESSGLEIHPTIPCQAAEALRLTLCL